MQVLEQRVMEMEGRELPAQEHIKELKTKIDEMENELYLRSRKERAMQEFAEMKKGENLRLKEGLLRTRKQNAKLIRR